MSYLVDTNIISEFVQPKPNPAVLGWLTDHQAEGLFLSVITVGEIQQGINRLPKSVRRKRLQDWLYGSILRRYGDFILSIETKTMLVWGELTGQLMNEGRKLPVMDSLIAATAVQHELQLVTRNVADFNNLGLILVNPWD